MDLREIGWKDVYWIQLAQDVNQFLHFCEHSNEPLGSIRGRNFVD
jgi:hypothetical protein